jgi:hypothetical protein
MPARANITSSRLVRGQVALHDLRARTTIVAVRGDLRLAFRDHSLAWLGDAVPLTSITLHEGQCFVTPQRGIVSISAAHAPVAAFALQVAHAQTQASNVARRLAAFLKVRLRRAA